MFWWVVLAIFLFLLCAVLLIAEIFVPSFGLLTLCSLISLAGGIAIFFKISPTTGWSGIFVAAIMIPAVFIFAYKVLPKTRFGKGVSLEMPKRQKGEGIPDAPILTNLLGKRAITITPLRPVGICDFSGTRLECVAETGLIEKGKTVEVINVEGTQLTVREIENS